ncbi:hypothetical protein GKZ28_14640 [Clostridium chromiireducens]|uniref:Uncharacterized protein n=1 Tax=Clostridium chromiireducens TaxID=225345 RepID=A0A964W327_9CLOT|nr:hypothetical protein [Clostridium chromiireducens]MVX64930.1 hypothetical protein [Clostridium chromiireducens]
MLNILQQKIQENEKVYTDAKTELEKIMGAANTTYSSLLKDYNSQIKYIKNDSMLTSDGKKAQATKVYDNFIRKVNDKAIEYTNSLQNSAAATLKLIDDNKTENNDVLKGQKIPQIIYVSAMMNSIVQLQDAPMLKEVFEYACLENNFSTEVMNLIYMKANSLLNTANDNVGGKVVDETQSKAQERILNESVNVNKIINNGKLKTILSAIVTEINKYKHDYTKEFNDFKSTFESWSKRQRYPQNLYLAIDPRDDFKLDGILNKNDPWKIPAKASNPWG